MAFRFDTKAVHSGFSFDELTGAVMPPVYYTSTYKQKSPGKPISHYEYSRTHNPTREVLQKNLAALENAKTGLVFSSGCAAFAALLQTLPKGSHIVVSDDIYGGSYRLIAKVFQELEYTQCDMTDSNAVKAAIRPETRLIWIETPSNPMLKIIDITAMVQLKNTFAPTAIVAVDNTFATPFLQNPLSMGADCVCHSTTKYIGGHSDVIGGALLLNDDALAEKLAFLQNAIGAIPSPMDCFLLVRSIKTLGLRMRAHCANAMAIAEFLAKHPRVQKVYYPGLTSHPQHDLARSQMGGLFGGMISIILKGDKAQAIAFLEKVKLFTLAESLGGVESLIEHPGIMTHASIPAEQRAKLGISDSLIRLSVGIEDVADLIADLDQALTG